MVFLGPLPGKDGGLEELFACIFLEERFVTYRTVKVIDHQSENRIDLFLGIASIVR
jgi:hypothetical protein